MRGATVSTSTGETAYAAVHGSLAGLDAFIESEGSAIDPGTWIEPSPRRTAYIENVIANTGVLPTVFPPNRFCYHYYEFLASQDLSWVGDALEIGVGSGINSLIALEGGVGRLIGTDINENAVKNSSKTRRSSATRTGSTGVWCRSTGRKPFPSSATTKSSTW